jgi:hypothetical protein
MATKAQNKEAKAAESKEAKADAVELNLETQDGKAKKVKVKIADGFPTVRPLKGQNVIVKSADLMSLATGDKLEEATQKSFDQLGFGKDKAIAYLERLALIGSSMVEIKE